MEEIFDIYTREGLYLGKKEKSIFHSKNPGFYHKPVWIWIINSNNELLLKLINDILDLSKLEAGSVELKYENFDLAVYFNELAASMHRRVVNPQVRLVPVNPYETCTVRLDKNRLAQILTNFVTNAIQYTPFQ